MESAIQRILAERGIRITQQRRILLNLIENSSEHLHASDLLRLAKEQDEGIDRATVYRTLALLKANGLVEELDLLHLDGDEHHYELKDRSGHVHIGCTKCGKIIEFESKIIDTLKKQIRRGTGCQVNSVRIEVSALCPDCNE